MSEGSVRGACLCGTVRFEIELPTQFCAHCHCTMCQRNHGAAFVTWIRVASQKLRIVEGEACLTHFASSERGRRSFCRDCGTSLFCRFEDEPDHVDVPLANVDSEIDRAPQLHVFYDSHKDWVQLSDALPRLGGESGTEPPAEG